MQYDYSIKREKFKTINSIMVVHNLKTKNTDSILESYSFDTFRPLRPSDPLYGSN
jgi:hypothetical protein